MDRIRIPFPEIYEILLIPADFAKNIISKKEKFVFDFTSKRIEVLEQQVDRGLEEVSALRSLLKKRIEKIKN